MKKISLLILLSSNIVFANPIIERIDLAKKSKSKNCQEYVRLEESGGNLKRLAELSGKCVVDLLEEQGF